MEQDAGCAMDLPKCPYCGHPVEDYWTLDSSPETTCINEVECGCCGGAFICETEQTVTFLVRKIGEQATLASNHDLK